MVAWRSLTVSDDEEVTDLSTDEAGRARSTATDDSTVDRAAESFLALEASIGDHRGEAGRLVGLAEDVERISAADIPAGYPRTITTDEAIRLRVGPELAGENDTDGETAGSVYVEWPPSDGGELARLLALRGIDAADFGDLHGERVPLAVEDGFLVLRLPPGGNRGDSRGVYGILTGLAVNVFAITFTVVGAGAVLGAVPILLGLAVLNFVILPIATYLDARHLLTTTDWRQGPLFWATLAAIPLVNVLSSVAYLGTRRRAEEL